MEWVISALALTVNKIEFLSSGIWNVDLRPKNHIKCKYTSVEF